jgi:hypothetical protein
LRPACFWIFLAVLSLIDFLIPVLFLQETAGFCSGYLFWSILTLLMIVFAVFYTRNWRDPQ